MDTLFPITPEFPEGFTYYPEFISREEEGELLAIIKRTELHNMIFQGYTANRKVASFGFDYSFDKRQLTKGKEIPLDFNFIVNKVAGYLEIPSVSFAELLITEYDPGTVINWHRDAPPFGFIAGISLLSDCTFRLRPQEKVKQGRSSIISFQVQRRSLYVLDGPSRSDWQHSISPVRQTRYSVTFRTLK
jgi:alkylated DNA repair dioxygenase AlkB